jgi:flagellar motor protein MotB
MRRSVASATARTSRADGNNGDYFASMTDLMLGLIFVFIIMLMAFSLNLREAEQKMSQATRQITEADLARREMLREVAKILNGALPITIDEANGTLQLGGDILFPKGSADAYPEALPKLKLLGYALDRVLPCYAVDGANRPLEQCAAKRKGRLDAVYIEGHTDTTPIHTTRFQSNWDLSAARASETFNKLVLAYPALAILKNDHAERLIGVSGYGEYRPVEATDTEAGMQKNRRIELRFIMVSPTPSAGDDVKAQVSAQRSP